MRKAGLARERRKLLGGTTAALRQLSGRGNSLHSLQESSNIISSSCLPFLLHHTCPIRAAGQLPPMLLCWAFK